MYRGISKHRLKIIDNIYECSYFSSTSDDKNVAKLFSQFIMKIIIPINTNVINTNYLSEENKKELFEKGTEIILLPGKFLILNLDNDVVECKYESSLNIDEIKSNLKIKIESINK